MCRNNHTSFRGQPRRSGYSESDDLCTRRRMSMCLRVHVYTYMYVYRYMYLRYIHVQQNATAKRWWSLLYVITNFGYTAWFARSPFIIILSVHTNKHWTNRRKLILVCRFYYICGRPLVQLKLTSSTALPGAATAVAQFCAPVRRRRSWCCTSFNNDNLNTRVRPLASCGRGRSTCLAVRSASVLIIHKNIWGVLLGLFYCCCSKDYGTRRCCC